MESDLPDFFESLRRPVSDVVEGLLEGCEAGAVGVFEGCGVSAVSSTSLCPTGSDQR